jgi:hypothetical protein
MPLDREEYVEQAYFFRVLRERLADNIAAQDCLASIDQEILSTTRLPMAVQFLTTELKHSGVLHTGFQRLTHYFTPFQGFVIQQAEQEGKRFSMPIALMLLEREAKYRSESPTPSGLFVYELEAICRNRLGYLDGLKAISQDSYFDSGWRQLIESAIKLVGVIEVADLIYVRSVLYVMDERRNRPDYEPSFQPIFGEKEGKIAKASRGREPLYLFAALQRQLAYPEVPRIRMNPDAAAKIDIMTIKMRELENRVKLLESEVKGNVDLSHFGKPEILEEQMKRIREQDGE